MDSSPTEVPPETSPQWGLDPGALNDAAWVVLDRLNPPREFFHFVFDRIKPALGDGISTYLNQVLGDARRRPMCVSEPGTAVPFNGVLPTPVYRVPPETTPTLRDQFAMAALIGLLSGRNGSQPGYTDTSSKTAFNYADAMMEGRKRP